MYLILNVWPHSEDDLNMTSFLTPFSCSFLAKWKKKRGARFHLSVHQNKHINPLLCMFAFALKPL